MPDLFIDSGPSTNPKPESTQGGGTRSFGAYAGPLSIVNHATPSGSRYDFGVPVGTGAGVFEGESLGFIGPAMDDETLNGTWSAILYGSIVGTAGIPDYRLSARLMRWRADDTFGEYIGSEDQTANLTGTLTSFALSFGSDNITFTRGDRIYLEVWPWVDDDPSEPPSFKTVRFSYGSTNMSKITVPGSPLFDRQVRLGSRFRRGGF